MLIYLFTKKKCPIFSEPDPFFLGRSVGDGVALVLVLARVVGQQQQTTPSEGYRCPEVALMV